MTFKTLLIAASIFLTSTFTGMIATTTSAQAGDLSFSVQLGNGRYNQPRWHQDRYDDRYRVVTQRHRYCTPRRAIRKARRLGLHHPRIVRINKRRIKIVGRSRGQRIGLRLARDRNCSVLRIR